MPFPSWKFQLPKFMPKILGHYHYFMCCEFMNKCRIRNFSLGWDFTNPNQASLETYRRFSPVNWFEPPDGSFGSIFSFELLSFLL